MQGTGGKGSETPETERGIEAARHYHFGGIPWLSGWGRRAGCFPEKHQSFKGKARVDAPGFPIYEARGGEASCSLCG
ncbi:hypothetical protein SBA4_30021 [Candidatus Sulfopaludibacter sp. SbA4]|nr:hypothetical protein SBA4_30021 [Candidatus Sulfopaludibacter sp. SbA4]